MKWTLEPAQPFERHRETWRALNESGPRTQLLDPIFVEPLLREMGRGDERIAIGTEYGRPRALLLLERVSRLAWSTCQPSQAPLGLAVVESGVDAAEMLPGLMRALPGLPLVLSLTQQDPDLCARPADGGRLRTLDYIRTARVTIEGSFEDYWSARGRNLRRNLKRQRNKLEREGTPVRLEALTDASQMAGAIADYGRLESAGWKAQQGTAIHPDNDQGRFYRAMLEGFCESGEARVFRYWYGDRMVACDLCIHRDGVLIILKTTYDEDETETSPAMLMRQDAFERIFGEGGFSRLEFYGKVMDWHTKWSEEIRTLYHVTCYRWPIVARARELLARARP